MIEVSTTPIEINFSPTKQEEIVQNVRTLLTTFSGTVPYSRQLGIDFTQFIDAPVPVAQAQMSTLIVDLIEKHEPRVQVVDVRFESDAFDGLLKPIVRFEVIG